MISNKSVMFLKNHVLNLQKFDSRVIKRLYNDETRARFDKVFRRMLPEEDMRFPERVVLEEDGKLVTFLHPKTKKPHKGLHFASADYLGFSTMPQLKEACMKTLKLTGSSPGATRVVTGTKVIHKLAEEKISEFHQKDDTILYPSCTHANMGIFNCITNEKDVIISDEYNHSSLIMGIKNSKAKKLAFRNRDLADLEKKIQAAEGARIKLIVTDGVFSMDGWIAPLKEIAELADRYNCMILVDDCHGTGTLGATGRGTDEYCGVQNRNMIINTSMGKALGTPGGGYTTGPAPMVAALRNYSRPFLFSNPQPPYVTAITVEALELHKKYGAERMAKLHHNTRLLRDSLESKGFIILGDRDCSVIPLFLGESRLSMEWGNELFDMGFYATSAFFPGVPEGLGRVRCSVTAHHSEQDIADFVQANCILAEKFNLEPGQLEKLKRKAFL